MRRILMLVVCLLFSAVTVRAQDTLTLGQLVTVNISAEAPAPSLFFQATAGQRLNLQLVSITSGVFPTFTLYTADEEILQYTGNPARTNTLDGATVIPLDGTYRLEIWNVDALPGQIILLVEDAALVQPAPVGPTPDAGQPPTAPPAGNATSAPGDTQGAACTVMPQSTLAVNVREGPLNMFRSIAALQPGQSMDVVGRDRESAWYQVDTGGGLGWVAASVTQTSGDCASVPEVFVPIPSRTPTPTPTFTPTPIPTHTPTPVPTTSVPQGGGNGGIKPPILIQTQVFSGG